MREVVRVMHLRHGHSSTRTPTYSAWAGIIERCTNPNKRNFKDYGGRGITVCERWRDFAHFLADMGERPSSAHSIDRFPDNNGNYEPGNCRWATDFEQAANKRNNRLLTHDGVTKPLTAWARDIGIRHATLRERLDRGWPVSDALSSHKRNERMLDHAGKTMSLKDWAKQLGIPYNTIRARHQSGFPVGMVLHKGRFKSGAGSPRR